MKNRRNGLAVPAFYYALNTYLSSLSNPAQRQSKVHTDVAGAEKPPAVLPGHADIPAGPDELVNAFAVLGAPAAAVQEEHIRPLGLRNGNAIEALCDEIAGVVHVA